MKDQRSDTEESGRNPGAGKLLRAAGTALSLILFVWLISRQDWSRMFQSVSRIPIHSFALVLGLLACRYVFQTLRWLSLLRAQGIEVGFGFAIRLVFTGLFASNFLPTTIGGDVVRLVGILPLAESAVAGGATLIADRVIGAMSMLPFLPITFSVLGRASWHDLPTIGALSGLLVPFGERLDRWFEDLKDMLALWVDRPASLLLAFLYSTGGAVTYVMGIWILARAIGIDVDIFEVAGVSGATYYITLIPISISGYGVREIGLVGLYSQLGVPVVDASTLAIVSRLLMLGVSLPGAFGLSNVLGARGAQRSE